MPKENGSSDTPILPSPDEYLPDAIQKAVVETGVKHPLTVYPVALGVSSAVVGLLFEVPVLLAAALGLGLLGPIWAVVSIFFRHEALGGDYLRKLHRKQKEYETHLVKQLETGLAECAKIGGMEDFASQGGDQLRNIRVKFDNIKELLDMKLRSGEITYGRFLGAAEQVSLSVLDNLNAVVGLLKSAGSIEPAYIEKRLKAIGEKKEKSDDDMKQVDSLRRRLDLWKTQLRKVERLLASNEEAMTEMEVISAAAAQWRTGPKFSSTDFETAIARLHELARNAHEYDNPI